MLRYDTDKHAGQASVYGASAKMQLKWINKPLVQGWQTWLATSLLFRTYAKLRIPSRLKPSSEAQSYSLDRALNLYPPP